MVTGSFNQSYGKNSSVVKKKFYRRDNIPTQIERRNGKNAQTASRISFFFLQKKLSSGKFHEAVIKSYCY